MCDNCNIEVKYCDNRVQHGVCNGAVVATSDDKYCRYCDLNAIIPDLSVEGNLEKWKRLEFAKHRVLYDCDRLGLPVDDEADDQPRLSFEFKSPDAGPVSTGHADGVITISLAEADSVQREQTRIQFGEPHRTLVGHFRHELGHFYWQRLVSPERQDNFREIFGDERSPSYSDAQEKYYKEGPPADWRERFVSQYAAMHPWEDFAETFNTYMDMIAIVGTAEHFPEIAVKQRHPKFSELLRDYTRIGIVANEFNRDIGLLDLVPEVYTPVVIEKLKFVDRVVEDCEVLEPLGK